MSLLLMHVGNLCESVCSIYNISLEDVPSREVYMQYCLKRIKFVVNSLEWFERTDDT